MDLPAPYTRAALRGDMLAGASVALVSLPSAVACAELLGVPAVTGLYAAIGGMVGYALLGTARRIIVAPDPAIAALAGAAIGPLAGGDPFQAAALASAVALSSGALLVVAARLSAGDLADLLSRPVLAGYLNGVALTLVSGQLGRLLGVELRGDNFFGAVADAVRALPRAHLPTLGLGLGLLLLLGAATRFPRLPGPLIACALGAGIATFFPGVAVLGPIPRGFPTPAMPAVGLAEARALLPAALAVALLAFTEGVVLARAMAARHGERVDPDRELLAFGVASVVAGIFGGFPVNASQSRSAIAEAAGARSQVAQWTAAALLLAFVAALSPWLEHVPLVALSAVVVLAAARLVDLDAWTHIRRYSRRELAQSLGVTLTVLAAGLVPGLLLGMALSLLLLVVDVSRPRDAVLRRLAGDHRFHDLDEGGSCPPGVVVYRLYGPLLFVNARHVTERVRELATGARIFVFDFQAVPRMDLTAMDAFVALVAELGAAGVDVRFAHTNRPLREQMLRHGPIDERRFFHAAWEAVGE